MYEEILPKHAIKVPPPLHSGASTENPEVLVLYILPSIFLLSYLYQMFCLFNQPAK